MLSRFQDSKLKLCSMILACSAGFAAATRTAEAEERKFLVILANMPRSFVGNGGAPTEPLPSLDLVNQLYFRVDPDDGVGSFAEYWNEISYGLVRIDGRGLGIVELPWPQYPVFEDEQTGRGDIGQILQDFSPDPASDSDDATGGFFELNLEGDFQFGAGERIREESVLYNTDFTNTAGQEDLPVRQAGTGTCFPGHPCENQDTVVSEDLDEDGHLDLGLEDIDGDDRFDATHEDLNGNCLLDTFPINEDLDNDGRFDIGENPNGCELPLATCTQGNSCDSCTCPGGMTCFWPQGLDPPPAFCFFDLNGDGIPSATEDLDGDGNFDILSEDVNGNCVPGAILFPTCPDPDSDDPAPCCPDTFEYAANPGYQPVWTPGERFRDLDGDSYFDAFFEPAVAPNDAGIPADRNEDGIMNNFSDSNRSLTDPGDFADTSLGGGEPNATRQFPEPYEDYMVMRTGNVPGLPQYGPVTQEYVLDNYPGNVPMMLRRTANHIYDSPDFWDERPSTNPEQTDSGTAPRKLEQDVANQPFEPGFITPEPSWFGDFWRARYGPDSEVPAWEVQTPRLLEYDPIEEGDANVSSQELGFAPNAGGTGGWGTVLEQMIHLFPEFGVRQLFPDAEGNPLVEDPDGPVDGLEDNSYRIVDYNGDTWAYAYPEEDLAEPLTITLDNDLLFGANERGTRGCIMPNLPCAVDEDMDGFCDTTFGCDFDRAANGVSEKGAFGEAPTWAPTAFPGTEGGLQDLDGDGIEDDFLFNPCDIPGHPDCPGGDLVLPPPFGFVGLFPPVYPDCPCVAFDVADEGGAVDLNGECDEASGQYIDPDNPPPDPPPTVDCFIPRCIQEENGSPYFPIPKTEIPPAITCGEAPNQIDCNAGQTCATQDGMPVCLTEVTCDADFSKRFGNGVMIEPLPEGASWPVGDPGDLILPPPSLMYDGPKEYDDLASSIYHTRWQPSGEFCLPGDEECVPAYLEDYGGDQALGEVTTTAPNAAARDFFGTDQAGFTGPGQQPGQSFQPDTIIIPAGPLAGGDTQFLPALAFGFPGVAFDGKPDPIHGAPGFDGGNQLALELLTRRTDGTSPTEPLTGPATADGGGFRDFNLDGLIDLGEGRAFGTENYVIDGSAFTANTGSRPEAYPFNRERLTEDVVEFLDLVEDFDIWVNPPVGCVSTPGVSHLVILPDELPDPNAFVRPAPSTQSSTWNPGFMNGQAINTLDDIDPAQVPPGDPSLRVRLSDMLRTTNFTDLAAELDSFGEATSGSVDETGDPSVVLVPYAAHEWGHFWECWPDLYDYDSINGFLVENPIGNWDLMATGGLVHVIPVFKESSGWIRSIDLRTVLTPGVEQTLNLSPIELVGDSYYFFENASSTGAGRVERFYFFHLQNRDEFSDNLPWGTDPEFACTNTDPGPPNDEGGMLILHTDLAANSEALSPQQRFQGHPTYLYEQADGQHSLEDSGGGGGDGGDLFPGECGVETWDKTTDPNNAFWLSGVSQPVDSGIEVRDIDIQPQLSRSEVTFHWFPQEVPALSFLQPAGGSSIDGLYPVTFQWSDVDAGTGLTLFYQRSGDGSGLAIDELGACSDGSCYQGTRVNAIPLQKDTPGNSSGEIRVAVGDLPDGEYRFYAFLDPAAFPGADDPGPEPSHTEPIFSDPLRRDDVSLNIEQVVLDRNDIDSARFEAWTVTYVGNSKWRVCGSQSGLQTLDGSYVPCDEVDGFGGLPHLATTGIPYETRNPDEAMRFTIQGSDFVSSPADRFVFVTTGFTPYSAAVMVERGEVDPGPQAIIEVTAALPQPCCFPGVRITYDGRESIDSSGLTGGIVSYAWEGDFVPPNSDDPTITVTYPDPGTFEIRLTVVEAQTNRTDTAVDSVDIRNAAPVAEFTATPDSGPSPLIVHLDASASADPAPADVPLSFEWDLDYDASEGFTRDLGPTPNAETDQSFECDDPSGCQRHIALIVRDALGHYADTDADGTPDPTVVTINIGNMPPVARFTATPSSGRIPLRVTFDASATEDSDGQADDLEYFWNFGDNTEVTTPDDPACDPNRPLCDRVTHTYTETGLWTASLRVQDGPGAESTVTQTIEVLLGTGNEITVNMTATPASGLSPLNVRLSATASDTNGEALSYRWDLGDGSIGFGPTVNHTYINTLTTEDREFNPVVIVSDPNGTQETATQLIVVRPAGTVDDPEENPELEVSFTLLDSAMQQGTAPLAVLFDTRGTRAVGGATLDHIDIDFGDGTSARQQIPGLISHTYSATNGSSATYPAQASAFADDNSFKMSSQIPITVFSSQPPFVSWAATPRQGTVPLVVGSDASGTFDPEEPAGSLSYEWQFGDGTQGGGIMTTHTYTLAGSYNVTLRVTDSTGAFASETDVVPIIATEASGGGGGLPPPDDGSGQGLPDGGSDGSSGSMCGTMTSAQMLLMLLGVYGLRPRRRRT